jgi:ribosomal protein S12 methylthiotransferase accessory factor
MQYVFGTQMDAESFSMGRGISVVHPGTPMSPDDVIRHLEEHPNDDLMHQYLQEAMAEGDDAFIRAAIESFTRSPSAAAFGILSNANSERYPGLMEVMGKQDRHALLGYFSSHHSIGIRELPVVEYVAGHKVISRLFEHSRSMHILLRQMEMPEIALPVDVMKALRSQGSIMPISYVSSAAYHGSVNTGTGLRETSLEDTLTRIESLPLDRFFADENITGYGFCGTYVILVNWKLDLAYEGGRNSYSLKGVAGSGGKGLDTASATASGIMEMVERISAGFGSTRGFPQGYEEEQVLRRAKLSELKNDNILALDPNSLSIRIPYSDHPLHWVRGHIQTRSGQNDILVPAQYVYMFPNADEVEVFRTSSNGLASGNTMEEAKLHGLLEILERDGDYTVPYNPSRVSTLAASDGKMAEVLERYAHRGLQVQLLDLTSEFGVPVYRAFVQIGSQVLSGSGSHLDGKIAAARAVCELSAKCFLWEKQHKGFRNISPSDPRVTSYEGLPDYSTGDVSHDLQKTEALLHANNLAPIYINLTRSDLGIPVVRTIVPGLEMPEGYSARQVHHLIKELQ